MKISYWIKAFRLRTLFLSLSCIWAGFICVQFEQQLNETISVLTLSTALLLQILSNLANDYGDSIHGADHTGRKGPSRMVQSGRISKEQMKTSLYVFASLAFLSGCLLLWFSLPVIGMNATLILLGIGLASIAAAIAYTNGKRPYGYAGLGDLSVLLFFGLVAIAGTQFLQTGTLKAEAGLLAFSFGSLSVGVLNLNNMRDIESDEVAGKKSIPVRLGLAKSKMYHTLLLFSAWLCLGIFIFIYSLPMLSFALCTGILLVNLILAMKAKDYQSFDPLLKWLSLSTFLLSLTLQLSV